MIWCILTGVEVILILALIFGVCYINKIVGVELRGLINDKDHLNTALINSNLMKNKYLNKIEFIENRMRDNAVAVKTLIQNNEYNDFKIELRKCELEDNINTVEVLFTFVRHRGEPDISVLCTVEYMTHNAIMNIKGYQHNTEVSILTVNEIKQIYMILCAMVECQLTEVHVYLNDYQNEYRGYLSCMFEGAELIRVYNSEGELLEVKYWV